MKMKQPEYLVKLRTCRCVRSCVLSGSKASRFTLLQDSVLPVRPWSSACTQSLPSVNFYSFLRKLSWPSRTLSKHHRSLMMLLLSSHCSSKRIWSWALSSWFWLSPKQNKKGLTNVYRKASAFADVRRLAVHRCAHSSTLFLAGGRREGEKCEEPELPWQRLGKPRQWDLPVLPHLEFGLCNFQGVVLNTLLGIRCSLKFM